MIKTNLSTLKRIQYNYILNFRVQNQKRIEKLEIKNDGIFSIRNTILINELKIYDKVLKSELIELDTEINQICNE